MFLRHLSRCRPLVAATAIAAVLCTASSARGQKYEVIDLGAIPGGYSAASGINNLGNVVGQARWPSTAGNHPFFFDGVTMHDLGDSGCAEAVNDSGWVVGGAGAQEKPYLWTQVGGMSILPTLGGDCGRAHGINSVGDVVGRASVFGNAAEHAVIWPLAGGIVDLGMLPGAGCTFSLATDVGADGTVVGISETDVPVWGYVYRAFRWTAAAGMEDLGTLGGPVSEAYAINSSGWVVGTADVPEGPWHAFLYRDGVMNDLGTLSEGEQYGSVATDVNDKGQVVGYSDMEDGRQHGFLWQNGQMIDLDTLLPEEEGWHIDFAYGINEDGWIACRGTTPRSPDTATAAILLRPAPKTPTTMWVRNPTGEPGRPVQLCAVLLRHDYGARIAGKTLTFTVGSWQAAGVTDAQGAVYLDYPVPVDAVVGATHPIEVAFTDTDDPDYATCSGAGTLTIGKVSTRLWVRSPAGEPGQTVQLCAALLRRSDSARIAGKTLRFTVGSWHASGVTDAQGVVYANYTVPGSAVPGGALAVDVAFSDTADPLYGTCSGTGTLTISKVSTWVWVRPLSSRCGETVQLCAVLLRSSDGARLPGKTLTFTLGSWQANATTNSQGTAYVNYPVPAETEPGATCTIGVAFADAADALYEPSSGTGTLKIAKASTRVWVRSLSGARGQEAPLCAVLLRLPDSVRISGRTLHFSIGSWQGSGVTDAQGAVYLDYPIPADAALAGHAIDVTFAPTADPSYLPSSGTGTLTVTP